MFGCCSRPRRQPDHDNSSGWARITLGISAIIGRIFSGLGSFNSVRDSASQALSACGMVRGAWHTLNEGLSNVAAGTYTLSDGTIKGLSEANRIFIAPEVHQPKLISRGRRYFIWFAACMNGLTTGASAYNGSMITFSFLAWLFSFSAEAVILKVIGAYFALIVFGSSANFNALEAIDLSGQGSFLTWEFWLKHVAMSAVPHIGNAAFSTYQVSNLLVLFKLPILNPANLILSGALAMLSNLNLSFTQIAKQRSDYLLAERAKYPELYTYEELASDEPLPGDEPVDQTQIIVTAATSAPPAIRMGCLHRSANRFGGIFVYFSPILNPLNTPQGLKSMAIVLCALIHSSTPSAAGRSHCEGVESKLAEYLFLAFGIAMAIPSSFLLARFRVEKAGIQWNKMTEAASHIPARLARTCNQISLWFRSKCDQDGAEQKDQLPQPPEVALALAPS